MFPEQSQALALIYEDVSYPECVQQAEVLAAKVDRTLGSGPISSGVNKTKSH